MAKRALHAILGPAGVLIRDGRRDGKIFHRLNTTTDIGRVDPLAAIASLFPAQITVVAGQILFFI
jgi:hypothetical protein